MARNTEEKTVSNGGGGRIRRAVSSTIDRLFHRNHPSDVEDVPAGRETASGRQTAQPTSSPTPGRGTKRPSDIGIDVLRQTYTPPLTSHKAGFRSDGADHQDDQEFARGVNETDGRWNDEDRFTNKSNDPRIGTHGRSYEPDETRGSRD